MDLNHRSPGYEPDGISRLPHLVNQRADLPCFETTDAGPCPNEDELTKNMLILRMGADLMKENLLSRTWPP